MTGFDIALAGRADLKRLVEAFCAAGMRHGFMAYRQDLPGFGEPAAATRKKIAAMSAPGRPVICTEWLYRPNGCDIPNILPIHKEAGVGSMLWGLVNGKAQTHLPNGGFTANYKGPWKHDLFHSDHRPYSVKDLELIRAATRAATK